MRVLAAVGLLLLGAGTGIATVALHTIGWGFALGTAATVVAAFALPAGWWSRLPYCAGWVAMVSWLAVPRPEGDYVLSSDSAGYAVLGLGVALLVFGIATLPRPTRPDRAAT